MPNEIATESEEAWGGPGSLPRVPASLKFKAKLDYIKGDSMRVVAERYDLSTETVKTWVRRDGWSNDREKFERERDTAAISQLKKYSEDKAISFGTGQMELAASLQELTLDEVETLRECRNGLLGDQDAEDIVKKIDKILAVSERLQKLGQDIYAPVRAAAGDLPGGMPNPNQKKIHVD
jgi:hypothetical protein